MRSISVVMVLLLASSCVTSRGTVPPAPTDADLANDGSAAEQTRLERKYSVELTSTRAEIGRDVVRGRRPFTVLFPQMDSDVTGYLSSDAEARAELPAGAWSFLTLGLNVAGVLLVTVALILILPVGTVNIANQVRTFFVGPGGSGGPPQETQLALGIAAMAVLLTSLVPFGVAQGLMWNNGRLENNAAILFNRNLRTRIQKMARPQEVPVVTMPSAQPDGR